MNTELLPAIEYDAAMSRNADRAWRAYVDNIRLTAKPPVHRVRLHRSRIVATPGRYITIADYPRPEERRSLLQRAVDAINSREYFGENWWTPQQANSGNTPD